jgi:DMSO/TMAO reductase YedYZ molybdopterin-dependent catalytic subunit
VFQRVKVSTLVVTNLLYNTRDCVNVTFRNKYKADVALFTDKMEKIKRYKRALLSLATVLVVALVIVGIYTQQPLARMLYPDEVREYEGQDLSSISNFRENSIKGPQYVNESTYRLKITGVVNKTLEYTYDEVINGFPKYQKIVTLHCVEGWSVKILWEGFLLKDLLIEAGIDPKAVTVIFYAYDGYSTAHPLDYILNNDILIAYKINGVVLPPERGFPFQLVAESKYGYKWIKWITTIELSDNADYLGYWERRGYSNDATVP